MLTIRCRAELAALTASTVHVLDRFKGVDLRFIKKIIPYAKVAVVISKADSLTEKEVRCFHRKRSL